MMRTVVGAHLGGFFGVGHVAEVLWRLFSSPQRTQTRSPIWAGSARYPVRLVILRIHDRAAVRTGGVGDVAFDEENVVA
jgi:hypothetical protein